MKIIWTYDSKEDLQGIRKFYVRSRSVKEANETIWSIRQGILILLEFPRLGHPICYSNRQSADVRMMVLGLHKVYYVIRNDEIRILRIWDSRQEPNRLLF